jgi:hypothetical protein
MHQHGVYHRVSHSHVFAFQAGFSGGLVVDYPHSTRAKKFFLVLMVGPSMVSMPQVRGLHDAVEQTG